ncbi:MAG: hypothetical protein P0S96_00235 [Simkaniaceae bacterium]|nr:hypothetical protein [Candidatus Sacchlamyda saccharinae]
MNILPLVSAFLIIFAICSFSFVHSVRTIIEDKTHYASSFRIQRKYLHALASRAYTRHKGKNLHPAKKVQEPEKKDLAYRSPRDFQRKKTQSKLNIYPLLQGKENPKLEKIALTLLQDLYFLSPFYKPGLENQILHTLKETFAKDDSLTNFHSLLTKIPSDEYPLFYRLVKGTHSYKIYTSEGYPALGDFLSLEKINETAPPANFCHASRPVLNAVFGPTLAPLIINEEKHKWEPKHKHAPLTKQELEAFLLSKRLNPTDYEPLLSFSGQSQPPPLEIIYDEESKIQIKIPL